MNNSKEFEIYFLYSVLINNEYKLNNRLKLTNFLLSSSKLSRVLGEKDDVILSEKNVNTKNGP